MTARVTLAEYRQLSLWKGPRQRGKKPAPAPEFNIQCMVADDLARWAVDGWMWSHFPAGGYRSKKTAGLLKRMGTRPGWPDFVLISPRGEFCALELKRPGGVLTDSQRAFRDWCVAHNVSYAVVYSYREAVAVLKEWGVLKSAIAP